MVERTPSYIPLLTIITVFVAVQKETALCLSEPPALAEVSLVCFLIKMNIVKFPRTPTLGKLLFLLSAQVYLWQHISTRL